MSRSAVLFLAAVAALRAQDARAIVQESQKRGQTRSQRYEGSLEVVDSGGRITPKRWVYERLGAWGESKALLRFTAPAEVKGVTLLVVNHPDRASDQWMWTPAIHRERRIALQDRSTRFFGTDFSFEDLEERDVGQSDYRIVAEESLDGAACWNIEFRPRRARVSQYDRGLLWIRKDRYVAVRVESFVKDQLVRRLNYRQIEPVQNVWTARLLEMEDLRRRSRTVMRIEKLEYGVTLSEDDFTVAALRRTP